MAEVFDPGRSPASSWAPRGRIGLRRTAERIPVTRKVVDRFVPGETVPEVVKRRCAAA